MGKIGRLPPVPRGFGNHAGKLAENVRRTRKLLQVFSPRGEKAVRDHRFGDVVQDKRLPRELLHQLRSDAKMLGNKQQVIGQIELPQPRDAVQKPRAQHELIVRLVLNDVAYSDELRMSRETLQLTGQVRGQQVHPPDNTLDESVFSGEFKQPACLFQSLTRLHCNAPVEMEAQI